ncbi:hypothetical protein MLD38_022780 [Melastoma candidum]|uniref:Uncharacterized protein n=1 Tax=Melastoma candidum TaxID=119954 RepID=A0ACB9QJJ7_9MYRT|nr:hypothetical protein MLD38_022780 [Melastoma candidum]
MGNTSRGSFQGKSFLGEDLSLDPKRCPSALLPLPLPQEFSSDCKDVHPSQGPGKGASSVMRKSVENQSYYVLGHPTANIRDVYTLGHKLGQGQLEFIAATIHLNKLEHEEHIVAAFQYFDKDGSGYITIDELQQACLDHNTTDVYIEDIIREVDQDNDGRIDYGEFVAMMQKGNAGIGRRTMRNSLNISMRGSPHGLISPRGLNSPRTPQ